MNGVKRFLNSSKGLSVLAGVIFYIAGIVGPILLEGGTLAEGLRLVEWTLILAAFGVYPVTQAFADMGKEKAKIESGTKLAMTKSLEDIQANITSTLKPDNEN